MNQLPDTEQFPQVDISSTFGLHPDMTVEVLTMENRLTFVGKVETVRNGAVVLREAKGDSLPPVMYNREIKLRYFQGERGRVVVFGRGRDLWACQKGGALPDPGRERRWDADFQPGGVSGERPAVHYRDLPGRGG